MRFNKCCPITYSRLLSKVTQICQILFVSVSFVLIFSVSFRSSYGYDIRNSRKYLSPSERRVLWNKYSNSNSNSNPDGSLRTRHESNKSVQMWRSQHEKNRHRTGKIKSQSRSEIKKNLCATAKQFLLQIKTLISTGYESKNVQKIWKRFHHCESRKKRQQDPSIGLTSENKKEEETRIQSPFSEPNAKSKALLIFTGLGSIIASIFLWIILVALEPKPNHHIALTLNKKKPVIQNLHIHPPESAESEEEDKHKKESEESDKKKAAVKVGLAREILAINAESIHLAAHILEFLFIMTKIARVLNERGIANIPVAPPFGQFLTQKQAQELLVSIGNNFNNTDGSALGGISGSLKNPLAFLGNKGISSDNIIKSAINNPAAAVALKKLLQQFESEKKVNATILAVDPSSSPSNITSENVNSTQKVILISSVDDKVP